MKQSRTSSLSRPLDPVLIHPVLPCWIEWLLFLCGGSIGKAICSTAGWQYATVSDHVKWHHLHKSGRSSCSSTCRTTVLHLLQCQRSFLSSYILLSIPGMFHLCIPISRLFCMFLIHLEGK